MVQLFAGPRLSLPGGGGKIVRISFKRYWVSSVLIVTTGLALKSMLTCYNASIMWMWNGYLDILCRPCSREVFLK